MLVRLQDETQRTCLSFGNIPMKFGRAIRPLWELDDAAAFLNHGSFGACPKAVLAEQGRLRLEMERRPDQFMRNAVMPTAANNRLRAAAGELAAFVGARECEVAFVENATSGVQAILDSIDLKHGDQILITDHTYNAVRLMVEARCAATGAIPIVARIPIPTSDDHIVSVFEAALTPKVKVAVIDHITSPSALVMPLPRLIPLLRKYGALVAVDGAHAVGQLPLDLSSLQPDWYVSNAHKWLFAPKGTAFLYVSPAMIPRTRPSVVSHFIDMGFPWSFDWTGTRDYSAWLAVPSAIAFFKGLGPEAVREYQSGLLDAVSGMMAALGAQPIAPIELAAAMRSFVLPQRRAATAEDAVALMNTLWERERIQGMAVLFQDRLMLRVSAQVYLEEEDLRRLAAALERHFWPGR